MRPGSAQALRVNDESFNSEHIRTNEEDDILFARSRNDTFKHAYCDYDISDMKSSVGNYSSANSVHSESSVMVVKDERWYDKSSSAYFTSDATRNAQTVSFRQRQRPIFQIYVDLLTGILIGSVMMMSAILMVRKQFKKSGEQLSDLDFEDFLYG